MYPIIPEFIQTLCFLGCWNWLNSILAPCCERWIVIYAMEMAILDIFQWFSLRQRIHWVFECRTMVFDFFKNSLLVLFILGNDGHNIQTHFLCRQITFQLKVQIVQIQC